MISLLFLPFIACIILVLIHVYFGSFILKRGIIFIDLALAQWAALGYLIGHWLHLEHSAWLFVLSFGFTVLASLLLSILKPIYNSINVQEAVIGVTYIAATAISIGLISSTGMEVYHLNDMLKGQLLFIEKADLGFSTLLYIFAGLTLYFMRKRFLNENSIKWDLLFYVLFGLVVTSSVKMVGILLVFSYLVLPLLSIIIHAKQHNKQIQYSWILGIIGSTLGLISAVIFDMPPSIAIILMLTIMWLISIVIKKIRAIMVGAKA